MTNSDNSQDTRRSRSLRDMLLVIFRYKWAVLGFSGAVCIFVAHYALSTSDSYVSTAKLFVTQNKETTMRLITGVESPQTLPEAVNTEVELLQSRGFATAVVEHVGAAMILPQRDLNREPSILRQLRSVIGIRKQTRVESPDAGALREQAIRVFSRSFTVKNELYSSVISLSYTSSTPENAQTILTLTVELYLKKHLE